MSVLQRIQEREAAELAAKAAQAAAQRRTFVIPDGHEAVLDGDGRATGETKPTDDAKPASEPAPAAAKRGGKST